MFAVIQHQQQRSHAKRLLQSLLRETVRLLFQVQRPQQGQREKRRGVQGSQIYKPDSIRELPEYLLRHRDSEPRLAHPAGSNQRDQTAFPQPATDLFDLLLPPNQIGERNGQTARRADGRGSGR